MAVYSALDRSALSGRAGQVPAKPAPAGTPAGVGRVYLFEEDDYER
jgi:hypothetical protein